MSLIINTWRDPYDSGFSLTRPKQIEINEGITVLVGCNGAGKTTLLMNIGDELKKQNIAYHKYDNLSRDNKVSLFDKDAMHLYILKSQSSEGEGIKIELNNQSTLYKEFLKTGEYNDRSNRLRKMLRESEEDEIINEKIRVLLYDATDSGLSIDNIIELKSTFKSMIKYSKSIGIELYIIISANEYELCRNSNCFDVNKGKYITFDNYDSYRNFIIKSRELKEKRIEKQSKWRDKQREKELEKLEKLKITYYIKKKELENKKEVSMYKKYNIKRPLEDFLSKARFLTEEEKKIEW